MGARGTGRSTLDNLNDRAMLHYSPPCRWTCDAHASLPRPSEGPGGVASTDDWDERHTCGSAARRSFDGHPVRQISTPPQPTPGPACQTLIPAQHRRQISILEGGVPAVRPLTRL